MIVRPRRPLAACAAILLLAAPALAGRPPRLPARMSLPAVGTVIVHRGVGGAAPLYAEGYRAAADIGYPGFGVWTPGYGREDDAAIFAARYGCVRPIWNAKSDRYVAACN